MPTVRELMNDGTARLERAPHPDRARQDAESLLLHVVGRDKAWRITHPEESLTASQAAEFSRLLERRTAGEPMQYILGETEFYGLAFRVTPAVLIPRPETELLVEMALALAAGFEAPRIVDVGTGSGAIAVALAHHLPQAAVTAIDLSAAALEVARQNAARHEANLHWIESDLLAAVAGQRFEMIVSNPPYVPEPDRAGLSVEVRDHEPELALFAGEDGLAVYRRLIPTAFSALVPGGSLLIEIGFGQAAEIARLFADSGFEPVKFSPDLQGIARVASAQRP